MSPSVQSILQQAMSLPPDQRLELLDALDAVTAAEAPLTLDQDWIDELDRRWAAYESGESKVYTWEEVKAEARRRLQS
jgi:putative addiction module component (TIGR02574 family)